MRFEKLYVVKKYFSSVVALTLLVSLLAMPGSAVGGAKLINVQGKITDNTGAALSGNITVTFRMYVNSSGMPAAQNACTSLDPNCKWMESLQLSAQNGLFNVTLGNVNSLDGVPFAQPYYLGMQVAGDSSELQPRQLLGASAYALGSLGDFNVAQSVSVSSNVSVGNTLSVQKNITLKGQDLSIYLVPSGAILPFAGINPPTGYLLCDGSAISRATYASLFSALGISWGSGDGSTTFNLPDLRGKTPIGAGRGSVQSTLLTSRTLGQSLGEEAHTLVTTEIPSHSHGITDPGHAHGSPDGGSFYTSANGYTTASFGNSAINKTPQTASARTGISIQNTGGDLAHNNMQPSAVVNYIIKS